MISALDSLSPSLVIVSNTGYHQDKLVCAAARHSAAKPVVAMDLPNLYPALGLDVDFFVSPSHEASAIDGVREAASTAHAPVHVLSPSVDDKFLRSDDGSGRSDIENYVTGELHNRGCSEEKREIGDCLVVGYVGRLSPEKSVSAVVSAFALAIGKMEDTNVN